MKGFNNKIKKDKSDFVSREKAETLFFFLKQLTFLKRQVQCRFKPYIFLKNKNVVKGFSL